MELMSLGSRLKNCNRENTVSDSGSQDTQRSKTKPEGGAVSVWQGQGKPGGEIPREIPAYSLWVLSTEEPASQPGRKPGK